MVIYEVKVGGRIIGRCNAKCHDATNSKCTCICGGAFHGVGAKIASEDRNTLSDDELLESARVPSGSDKPTLIKPPFQLEMF